MKTTTFGSYIRFLRMQINMTQSQLAEKPIAVEKLFKIIKQFLQD